jgi:hypothetical protein
VYGDQALKDAVAQVEEILGTVRGLAETENFELRPAFHDDAIHRGLKLPGILQRKRTGAAADPVSEGMIHRAKRSITGRPKDGN